MIEDHLPPVVTAAARDDMRRAFLSYELKAGEALAYRFLDASERAISLIGDFPNLGARSRSVHDTLRRVPLPRPFSKWLVFYRLPSAGEPEIVRIIHGAADWLFIA